MHANQIEETNELTVCDQLHVQPTVFSSQKAPVTNNTYYMIKIIVHKNFFFNKHQQKSI